MARAWDNCLHYFNKGFSTLNDVLSLMIQTYEYRKTFWITCSSDMQSVTLTIHIITSQPKCVVSQNSCNRMPQGKDKFEILNGSKWITINVVGKKRERRREQNSGESSALSDEFPVLDLGLCTLPTDSITKEKYSATGARWKWKCKSGCITCLRWWQHMRQKYNETPSVTAWGGQGLCN